MTIGNSIADDLICLCKRDQLMCMLHFGSHKDGDDEQALCATMDAATC